MPTLFLTVGLPGFGKTTAARKFEVAQDALRLTKDEWMKALYGAENPRLDAMPGLRRAARLERQPTRTPCRRAGRALCGARRPHVGRRRAHLCQPTHLCSEVCVDRLVGRHNQGRGYVVDLMSLWRLAEHWYDGRLQPGYTVREPASAGAYLTEVGLTREFWQH